MINKEKSVSKSSLSSSSHRDILVRHSENPILRACDMPFDCSAVFNAGTAFREGKVYLVLRTEDFERETRFHLATSIDGIDFEVDPEPIRYPLRDIEKEYGSHRFDMRITEIDGVYYACHALMLTGFGSMIAMARSKDLKNYESLPSISPPFNRNAVLFPEKVNGMYARLERPVDDSGSGQIWISYSKDLVFWGKHEPVRMPRVSWAERKSGAGAIPIRTERGWLCIYHTTCHTASTENYYLGAMLLDLENPAQTVGAPRKYLLGPEESYECVGQVPNVVFTGGAVEMPDGTLNIYYGGADTCMCLAQTSVEKLINFCLAGPDSRPESMWH